LAWELVRRGALEVGWSGVLERMRDRELALPGQLS
jgi:hypothetical protein